MSQKFKTIIIDDEPPAITRLEELTAHFPETFQIIATAKNGKEGVQKINELEPDLIFLDIQMPGLTGFELLEKLNKIPIIIFCTAYDQYSLQAFETNSIDYLVKPVRVERLRQTVGKLNSFKNNLTQQNILEVLKEFSFQKEEKEITSITIKKDGKLIFVKLDEVSHFEYDANYVTVYTDKGNHLCGLTLSQLEDKLPSNFLRVHRGVIINTNFVKEVQKHFNSRFVISLTNTNITSGRSYNEQIKSWMDI